ncbi:hypothetical protein SAMN05216251_104340 [Actinacidiphila alni]|uniref:Uncharacterized protein n=1 Tax=Actinacidiphila alni TaxID=380248 RepID=A0A1I2CJY3_9ACTN|nr:hypothetical protein [Actinacidiphila alni]SFE68020.1 hypothetical protein SAMN05216251_104340 [Actinacidiphila alni]
MAGAGAYRWRTRVRGHLPWFLLALGVACKGGRDCGSHEWYRHDRAVARCYHCAVGERPWPAGHGT